MASSIISDLTSDEKLSESVRKYPVLFDKSGCDFKNRLKKQMARADVASEVGLQNGKCCDELSFSKDFSNPYTFGS